MLSKVTHYSAVGVASKDPGVQRLQKKCTSMLLDTSMLKHLTIDIITILANRTFTVKVSKYQTKQRPIM